MIALYRWVLRPLGRRLALELVVLALRLQVLFWEALVWARVHGPVQFYSGPVFEGVRVQVLDSGPLWFAFYISRDRTGAWWNRWPHISIFRDNG
jgi:hypothetical protein